MQIPTMTRSEAIDLCVRYGEENGFTFRETLLAMEDAYENQLLPRRFVQALRVLMQDCHKISGLPE